MATIHLNAFHVVRPNLDLLLRGCLEEVSRCVGGLSERQARSATSGFMHTLDPSLKPASDLQLPICM